MTKSMSKDYYERMDNYDKKHRYVLDMAKNRGEVAKKWLSENKLTQETQSEFNALMKKADKEYKLS